MAFCYRPLEDGDAQAICDFAQSEEELFFFFPGAGYPLNPKQLLDIAGQREAPTVALSDGEVVGYANFVKVRPNLFCALGNLIINPLHRRRGVATGLVKTMIRIAMDRYKARFVRAACFSHNTAGYQFYHRLGFKPAKMDHRTAPDGDTVLLVNMELVCKQKASAKALQGPRKA